MYMIRVGFIVVYGKADDTLFQITSDATHI